ncbi:MAG: bifunctional demethylmenaquinone methyltransferase/2-methoxy-6-polyprenyl-1,4-benzoquinol methylase UbiE [Deltaproteobacteria bacterium]|nr:bifunctional demethylmenaquinone methyltransferase/2-methoxy-6-polyprenyl-1,4-benzoquinol methylase UbiE [Deltaproteobacteria bacterium]
MKRESKEPGVQKMFDAIAGRYDLMNRVMTMGQDQKWRRFVVQQAGDPGKQWSLDLATGTGDIAALMSDSYRKSKLAGGDFSLNMLKEARKRFDGKRISWHGCDANNLPFADDSFDSVTFGYLLRNVDDASRVLKEVFRVLRSGGRVVCLDTTPPAKNLLYPFLQFYFRFCIPALGKLIADDETAYAYLTGSTMEFYTAENLSAIFKNAGFNRTGYKKFMMGTIAVHWGEK